MSATASYSPPYLAYQKSIFRALIERKPIDGNYQLSTARRVNIDEAKALAKAQQSQAIKAGESAVEVDYQAYLTHTCISKVLFSDFFQKTEEVLKLECSVEGMARLSQEQCIALDEILREEIILDESNSSTTFLNIASALMQRISQAGIIGALPYLGGHEPSMRMQSRPPSRDDSPLVLNIFIPLELYQQSYGPQKLSPNLEGLSVGAQAYFDSFSDVINKVFLETLSEFTHREARSCVSLLSERFKRFFHERGGVSIFEFGKKRRVQLKVFYLPSLTLQTPCGFELAMYDYKELNPTLQADSFAVTLEHLLKESPESSARLVCLDRDFSSAKKMSVDKVAYDPENSPYTFKELMMQISSGGLVHSKASLKVHILSYYNHLKQQLERGQTRELEKWDLTKSNELIAFINFHYLAHSLMLDVEGFNSELLLSHPQIDRVLLQELFKSFPAALEDKKRWRSLSLKFCYYLLLNHTSSLKDHNMLTGAINGINFSLYLLRDGFEYIEDMSALYLEFKDTDSASSQLASQTSNFFNRVLAINEADHLIIDYPFICSSVNSVFSIKDSRTGSCLNHLLARLSLINLALFNSNNSIFLNKTMPFLDLSLNSVPLPRSNRVLSKEEIDLWFKVPSERLCFCLKELSIKGIGEGNLPLLREAMLLHRSEFALASYLPFLGLENLYALAESEESTLEDFQKAFKTSLGEFASFERVMDVSCIPLYRAMLLPVVSFFSPFVETVTPSLYFLNLSYSERAFFKQEPYKESLIVWSEVTLVKEACDSRTFFKKLYSQSKEKLAIRMRFYSSCRSKKFHVLALKTLQTLHQEFTTTATTRKGLAMLTGNEAVLLKETYQEIFTRGFLDIDQERIQKYLVALNYFFPALDFDSCTLLSFYKYLESYELAEALDKENFISLKVKVAQKLFRTSNPSSRLEMIILFSKSKDAHIKAIAKEKLLLEDPKGFDVDKLVLIDQLYKDLEIESEQAFSIMYALCLKSLDRKKKLDSALEALYKQMIQELLIKGEVDKALTLASSYIDKRPSMSDELFYSLFDAAVLKKDLSVDELECLLGVFEYVYKSSPLLSRKEQIKDTVFELWLEKALKTKHASFVIFLLSESLNSSKEEAKSLLYLNSLLLIKTEIISSNLALMQGYLALLQRSFQNSSKLPLSASLKRAFLQVYLKHEAFILINLEKSELAQLLKQVMLICSELNEAGMEGALREKYVTKFLEYVAKNPEANLDDQLDNFKYLFSSMNLSTEALASCLSKLASLMPDDTERASASRVFWNEVALSFIESTALFEAHPLLIDELSICFWSFSTRVKTVRGIEFLSKQLMPYPDYVARVVKEGKDQGLVKLDVLSPWFFQLEFTDEKHREMQFDLLFSFLKDKKKEDPDFALINEGSFQSFIKDYELITTQEQLAFIFNELLEVFNTANKEVSFSIAKTFKELLSSKKIIAVLNQKGELAGELNGQLVELASANYKLFYQHRVANLENGEEAALTYINVLFSELNFFVLLSFQLDRRKLLQNSSREFFQDIFTYTQELEAHQLFQFSKNSPSSVTRDSIVRVAENEQMRAFYFNRHSFSLLKQGARYFCAIDCSGEQGYQMFSLHIATLLKEKKELQTCVYLHLERVTGYLSLTLTNEWTEAVDANFQLEINDLKSLLANKTAFRLSETYLAKFMYALQDCSLTLGPKKAGPLTPAFHLCFDVFRPSLIACLKESVDDGLKHISFKLASQSLLLHNACSLPFCNKVLLFQSNPETLLNETLDLFDQAVESADSLEAKARLISEELAFLPDLLIQDKERYLEEAVRVEEIAVLLLDLYEDPQASEEIKDILAVAWGDYYSTLIVSWGISEAFSSSTITLEEYETVVNELTQLISIEKRYERIKKVESSVVASFLEEIIKFSGDDEGAIEALLLLHNFFDLDLSVGFRKSTVEIIYAFFDHEKNTLEYIKEISLFYEEEGEPPSINKNGACIILALKFLADSSISYELDKEAFKRVALLYFNRVKFSELWSNAAVFEVELAFRMSLAKAALAFQKDLKDYVTQDDGEVKYFIHIFYEQAIIYFDLKATVDSEVAKALTKEEIAFLKELVVTVGKEELINYSLSANKLLFERALSSYADFGVFTAENYMQIATTILRDKGPEGVIVVAKGLKKLILSEAISCRKLAEEYDCSLFILLDSVFATVRNRLLKEELTNEEATVASEILTLPPIRYYLVALIRAKVDNIFALNLEYIISYLFFFYLMPKTTEKDLLLAKLIKNQIYLPTRVASPEGGEMSIQALGGEIFADKSLTTDTDHKKSLRLVNAMSGDKPSLLGEMIEAIKLASGESKKEVEKKPDSVARERFSSNSDKKSRENASVQALPESLLNLERPIELVFWCELTFLWISSGADSNLCFEEYAVLSQMGALRTEVVLDNQKLRGYNTALDLGIRPSIVRDLETYASRVLHFTRSPLRTELNCLGNIDTRAYRDDLKEGESDLVRSHVLKIETIMRDLASQSDPATGRSIMSTDIFLDQAASTKGSAYTHSLQECYARYFHILALYADAKEFVLLRNSDNSLSYFSSVQVFAFRWQSVAKAVKGQGFVPLIFYTDGLCRKEQIYLLEEAKKTEDQSKSLDTLAGQRAKDMTYDCLDRVLQEYHVKKEVLKLKMDQEYNTSQLALKMAPFIIKACESMLFDPNVIHCLERTSRSFVIFATWMGYICTRILPECHLPNSDFERGVDALFFSPLIKIFKRILIELPDAEEAFPESKLVIARCLQKFFLPYAQNAVEVYKSKLEGESLPSYLVKLIEYGDEFFTSELLDTTDEALIDYAADIREAQIAYAGLKTSISQVT